MFPNSPETRTKKGAHVVLERIDFESTADELLVKTVMRQHYRNIGGAAAEAEYKFPVTKQSVVTRLFVEIGGVRYRAKAFLRDEAEEAYENALEAGDLPVMISCEADCCSALIGNLKPGETLVIETHAAEPLRFINGAVTLRFPTTIDFRYASAAMIEADECPEAPEVNLFADREGTARFVLKGELARSRIDAASLPYTFEVRETAVGREALVAIEHAKLNRDITLRLADVPLPATASGAAFFGRRACGPDGAEYAVLSLTTPEPERAARRALDLRLLIDCSGSMAGMAMAQVRKAVVGLMAALGPEDAAAGLRFGSRTELWFPAQNATKRFKRLIESVYADRLEADLGGTEMEAALQAAARIPAKPGLKRGRARGVSLAKRRPCILMITDGLVWDVERIRAAARELGMPVFIIAVGSSPADSALEAVAEASGGFVSYVAHGESMAGLCAQMVEMMRCTQQPAEKLALVPKADRFLSPAWASPGMTQLFFARWESAPADWKIRAEDSALGGIAALDRTDDEDLAKIAAHRFYLEDVAQDRIEAAAQMALENELVTPFTSFLAVQERSAAERTDGLPAFTQIAQMPALRDVCCDGMAMPQDGLTDGSFVAQGLDVCCAPLCCGAAAGESDGAGVDWTTKPNYWMSEVFDRIDPPCDGDFSIDADDIEALLEDPIPMPSDIVRSRLEAMASDFERAAGRRLEADELLLFVACRLIPRIMREKSLDFNAAFWEAFQKALEEHAGLAEKSAALLCAMIDQAFARTTLTDWALDDDDEP